jgi:acyl dehydratase
MWFEDVPIGEEMFLGIWHFTDNEVANFATLWRIGRRHGMKVEGLHICAVWNRLWIAASLQSTRIQGREGGTISPGILELRWPTPTYAGEQLSFTSTALERVPLRSRPELGLVRRRNLALKADGAVALSFVGQVLHSRRSTSSASSADVPPAD